LRGHVRQTCRTRKGSSSPSLAFFIRSSFEIPFSWRNRLANAAHSDQALHGGVLFHRFPVMFSSLLFQLFRAFFTPARVVRARGATDLFYRVSHPLKAPFHRADHALDGNTKRRRDSQPECASRTFPLSLMHNVTLRVWTLDVR